MSDNVRYMAKKSSHKSQQKNVSSLYALYVCTEDSPAIKLKAEVCSNKAICRKWLETAAVEKMTHAKPTHHVFIERLRRCTEGLISVLYAFSLTQPLRTRSNIYQRIKSPAAHED